MTRNKILLAIIFLFSTFNLLNAQNQVITTDGFVYKSTDNKIDSLGYIEIIKKNGKAKLIDTSVVFAVISGNDTTFLYDNQDYSLEKAKIFMQGQIDGRDYKNMPVYIGAFVTGVAAPIGITYANFSAFYSPLISVGYIATFSGVNTDNQHLDIPDEMRNNDDYVRGYKLSASRTKIKNMTLYSVGGLVTGFVILAVLGK